jgi:hypothetical protein
LVKNEARGYTERTKQQKKDRVTSMWEVFVDSTLSDERRAHFHARKEVGWLMRVPEDQLRAAAMRAMGRNSSGHLLLAEWWEAVLAVREDEARRDRGQAEPSDEPTNEGPLVRCKACGIGIDYYSGRCGCQL